MLCDYRKLVPRATGYFKVLRSCDFPSAGYAGDSVGDRARTNGSWCRDLLRRKWPTGGTFAFRPKRVSAAMPALQATKNSVRPENTEVPIIREIMVATKMSSRFRCPFRFGSLQFSKPCGAAGGDPCASSPTGGFPKERAASLASPPLRPALVGRVVPILVGLAAMSADGSARHSPPMAPQSFRLALDQEIAPPFRKAGTCGKHS